MKQVAKKAKKPAIFAVIGVLNTALDFALLIILSGAGFSRVTANTISTGTTFIFSFFMNRKYTFRSNSKHIVREIILFIAVTLFGLWVIQNFLIWLIAPFVETKFSVSHEIATLLAKLIATFASLVWNYILYDRFVFRGDKEPS